MKNVLFESLQVADLAHRLVLAAREPVGAALDAALDPARHLLLTGGDTGGDPVNALPHRVDIERDCFERGGLSGRAVGLPIGLPSMAERLAKPGAVGSLARLHVLHTDAVLAAKLATKADKMIEYELAAMSNR